MFAKCFQLDFFLPIKTANNSFLKGSTATNTRRNHGQTAYFRYILCIKWDFKEK